MIKTTTVQEINELISGGRECQVIDVREFSEFNTERIAEAQPMPLSNFEKHASEIDHSKPVYLMCRTGRRAADAAKRLQVKGFTDIHVVEGGMLEWAKSDLPVEKGDSQVWALERQVRFAAGLLVLIGVLLSVLVYPYFVWLAAFIGAGLIFAAVTDTCGMAMVLARMPWNKGPVTCEATKPQRVSN
ncbi:MAG: rhodanese-like domain-containing protein [Acidobacteriota bacterium]